jgi:hypothetical protein
LAHLPVFEFLKRRYASAIERADDPTATRLRAEIDRLINGPSAARAGPITGVASARPAVLAPVEPAQDLDDILGCYL